MASRVLGKLPKYCPKLQGLKDCKDSLNIRVHLIHTEYIPETLRILQQQTLAGDPGVTVSGYVTEYVPFLHALTRYGIVESRTRRAFSSAFSHHRDVSRVPMSLGSIFIYSSAMKIAQK